MYVLLTIVGLVASASAKDLLIGQEGGRIIFKENITASPAIWTQERTVVVNASETDVITRVVVIDNREDKNGEATILEGGEGHKNVTILLKGPNVFRELNFTVKVFAKPEDERPKKDDQETAQKPIEDHSKNNNQVPGVQTPGLQDNKTPKALDGVKHPMEVIKENEEKVRENRETLEQKPVNPIPSEKDNQNTKPDEKAEENKEQKTINDDQQAVFDKIFGEHNSSVEVEPKPGQPIDNDAALKPHIHPEVPKDIIGQKPADISTTPKVMNGQETVKQEFPKTKEQPATVVPLPYLKQID